MCTFFGAPATVLRYLSVCLSVCPLKASLIRNELKFVVTFLGFNFWHNMTFWRFCATDTWGNHQMHIQLTHTYKRMHTIVTYTWKGNKLLRNNCKPTNKQEKNHTKILTKICMYLYLSVKYKCKCKCKCKSIFCFLFVSISRLHLLKKKKNRSGYKENKKKKKKK